MFDSSPISFISYSLSSKRTVQMICPKCKAENPDESKFCNDCGTQITVSEEFPAHTKTIEAPRAELTTGSTFAERYQIIEELGRGGMGRVYKAHDSDVKDKVALKLIRPEISADKKTIERFQNELKLARKIGHRNVCRMYDLNKEEGSYYITMEYVSGEDLKSFVKRSGRLTVSKSIDIANQICEGLAEAHRVGVVHRDLKPSNIMIDNEGNARIMDFGIARSVEGKGITGAGVMIGTPEYMSPEQVEGKEIDQRTDIYSMGIILYEMLTGRVPFEGGTAISIAVKHKTETPKEPKEYNEQISDDLNGIILKCLEKDREQRFQSAKEVLSELEKIAKGIPTTDRSIPEKKPLTSREITVTLGLKKILVPVLVIVALIILAVFIWRPWSKNAPSPPLSDKPSLAVMYFENNTGDENLNHYRKAISDLLITDLYQSKHIRILSASKLYNILKELNLLEERSYSSEDLREVATRGGVKHVLLGSYTKAGDTFRININLQEASTAELVASERIEGKGEESIFSMVDKLTPKIKMNFELSQEVIESDIDQDVGQITTSSPEAYKYYVEAGEPFENSEYRKAIQLYEKAIALDPEFSTAYRSMAMAYWNMGYSTEARKYLRKAYEFRDRISERELYRLQAEVYRFSEETVEKAIEAYQKLVELYPDTTSRNNLGLLYAELEQWEKAIEQYELAIYEYQSKSHLEYINVTEPYMALGKYDKAAEILESYLTNITDHPMVHLYLAATYLAHGENGKALQEVDNAIELHPDLVFNHLYKGIVHQCSEQWEKAKESYNTALGTGETSARLLGYGWLASLYVSRGMFKAAAEQAQKGIELAKEINEKNSEAWLRFSLSYILYRSGSLERALKELDTALNIGIGGDVFNNQKKALNLKGVIALQLNKKDETKDVADRFEKMLQILPHKETQRLFHHFNGMKELENNNITSAIKFFNKAMSLMPSEWFITNNHAWLLEPLAMAYLKSGDQEKARETYRKITNLRLGNASYGDIYAKSFYMLGNIYKQQGNRAKAIEHYEKFLNLWKDADPGITEIEDARKSLAELKELP
ncbi:protein kinase [Acidobacteriota bacterium]